MTSVTEIEDAVARLPRAELAVFREWFDAFEAERFDARIDEDAASGRLDRLADEALADYRQGHVRSIALRTACKSASPRSSY